MKPVLHTAFLAGSLMLIGCNGGDKLWEDGNYRVYSRPNSRDVIMGYHFGDGGILGLSDPTVTAAGADSKHVVFQVDGSKCFYIVRDTDGEGTTHGPFNAQAFSEISKRQSLPPFEWHLER
jgi:hypothetical protein